MGNEDYSLIQLMVQETFDGLSDCVSKRKNRNSSSSELSVEQDKLRGCYVISMGEYALEIPQNLPAFSSLASKGSLKITNSGSSSELLGALNTFFGQSFSEILIDQKSDKILISTKNLTNVNKAA